MINNSKPIFFSETYLNASIPDKNWDIVKVKEGENVVAELYFRVVKKMGFTQLESVPLSPAINVVFYLDNNLKPVNRKKKERKKESCYYNYSNDCHHMIVCR